MNNRELMFILKMRDQASAMLKRAGQAIRGSGDEAKKAQAQFKAAAGGMDMMRLAAGALGGVLATLSVGAAAAGLTETISKFEQLQTSLKTLTGSEQGAKLVFAELERFAANTPYQLEEVVQGFSKLKARGLDGTVESLTNYGNVAAGMGKSLDQMIEAVADAATMEFERLKEFGINASKEGDKVSFTFQGVTTTVGASAKEIEGYLQGLGRAKFAGGMEEQSKTLAGMWSTLKDNVANFMFQIGEGGLKGTLKSAVSGLLDMTKGSDSLARSIGSNLATAAQTVTVAFRELGQHAQAVGAVLGAMAALRVAGTFSALAGALASLVPMVVGFLTAIGPVGWALMAAGAAIGGLIGYIGSLTDSINKLAGTSASTWEVMWATVQVLGANLAASFDWLRGKVMSIVSSDTVQGILAGLAGIGSALLTFVTNGINWVTAFTMTLVEGIPMAIGIAEGAFRGFIAYLSEVFRLGGDALSSFMRGDISRAGDLLAQAWNVQLNTGVGAGLDQMKAMVSEKFSTDYVGNLATTIGGTFSTTMNSLTSAVAWQVSDSAKAAEEAARKANGAIVGDAKAYMQNLGGVAAATKQQIANDNTALMDQQKAVILDMTTALDGFRQQERIKQVGETQFALEELAKKYEAYRAAASTDAQTRAELDRWYAGEKQKIEAGSVEATRAAYSNISQGARNTGSDITTSFGGAYSEATAAAQASASQQVAALNQVAAAAQQTKLAMGQAVAGGGRATVTRYGSNGEIREIRRPDGVRTDFSSEIEKFFGAGTHYASGGQTGTGQWALVGEEGPELVRFNQPGRVYTARQTREMLGSGGQQGGGNVVTINIDGARDPVEVAQEVAKVLNAGGLENKPMLTKRAASGSRTRIEN